MVEVAHVLMEGAPQMALARDEGVVRAFPPDVAEEPREGGVTQHARLGATHARRRRRRTPGGRECRPPAGRRGPGCRRRGRAGRLPRVAPRVGVGAPRASTSGSSTWRQGYPASAVRPRCALRSRGDWQRPSRATSRARRAGGRRGYDPGLADASTAERARDASGGACQAGRAAAPNARCACGWTGAPTAPDRPRCGEAARRCDARWRAGGGRG